MKITVVGTGSIGKRHLSTLINLQKKQNIKEIACFEINIERAESVKKEFNEISWGINQGKSDDLEDYSKLINTWLSGNLDNKFENGESPNEMSLRLVKGFNKVLEDNQPSTGYSYN